MIKKISSIFVFVWAVGLALVLRWSFLEVYTLPIQEMMPTLFAGDHVFVSKMSYGLKIPFTQKYLARWAGPKKGDVIIFKSPFDLSSVSISRVIGRPGDKIFFEDNILYVNEKKILKKTPLERARDFQWVRDEDFSAGGLTEDKSHYSHFEEELKGQIYSVLVNKRKKSWLVFGPFVVPQGFYFVMGDHRDRSQDSRTWPAGKNLVSEKHILGLVKMVWFSCEKTMPFLSFLCDPRFMRWNRTFHIVH